MVLSDSLETRSDILPLNLQEHVALKLIEHESVLIGHFLQVEEVGLEVLKREIDTEHGCFSELLRLFFDELFGRLALQKVQSLVVSFYVNVHSCSICRQSFKVSYIKMNSICVS